MRKSVRACERLPTRDTWNRDVAGGGSQMRRKAPLRGRANLGRNASVPVHVSTLSFDPPVTSVLDARFLSCGRVCVCGVCMFICCICCALTVGYLSEAPPQRLLVLPGVVPSMKTPAGTGMVAPPASQEPQVGTRRGTLHACCLREASAVIAVTARRQQAAPHRQPRESYWRGL